MAVDNPSYFSLSSGSGSLPLTQATTALGLAENNTGRGHTGGLAGLFRRKPGTSCKMGSGTSSGGPVNSPRTDNRKVSSSTSGSSTPTDERVPMLTANGIGVRSAGHPVAGSSGSQRRSFRNLFRSVSANSDQEMTRQFLRGEPRPADVAPPSPYMPHRSHSHSENDRQRPTRGNRRVLKSASELLSNDMVYCGLPTEDGIDRPGVSQHYHDDDEEDDDDSESHAGEVFLGTDDVRYYNISSTQPSPSYAAEGHRRHSTGTYNGKESHCSSKKPIQDPEVLVEPSTMAPPIPTEAAADVDVVDGVWEGKNNGSRSRNKCRRHRSSSNKGSRSATGHSKVNENVEDDIVIVSSKDSEVSNLWVNYLTGCFEQIGRQQGRPPFKVRHVTVEESAARTPPVPRNGEEVNRIGRATARLQIIVVCPILLGRIASHREDAANLSRHLISATDRVLAMMLGVQEAHITETHRAGLPLYRQWRKFFVKDQDETFVGEFLSAAVAILGTEPPPNLKSDKTAFSVHPKKVKLGQNRVITLLNDPLRPEDSFTVIVDRCGEAIEIAHVKKRNPYVLQFSIPDRCLDVSMLVGVRVFVNGTSLGVRQVKCESRLRELDQILRAHDNPLEFMCQTFGFNPGDREQLDNWMVHAFQRNLPPHFDLLSTPSGTMPAYKNRTSPEENPTLLHFAARFGLERLAWQLLECPGGDIACDLRNASELTPADLAEQAGHVKLAHQLRGYMQMNEFTNMYSYLKVISENASDSITKDAPMASRTAATSMASLASDLADKEDYCCPRPLSEAYSVPPAARPITTLISPSNNHSQTVSSCPTKITASTTDVSEDQPNYSIVPTPTPVVQQLVRSTSSPAPSTNGHDYPLQGYLKMHPAGPKTPTSNVTEQSASRAGTPTPSTAATTTVAAAGQNSGHSKVRENSTSSSSAGPQDELLEIINDFKNNVFTITEVERLVENWRNRNDVQQSFKDKQRQLTAMRDEYERIQKKMKDEMRAPTPFDRIRKLFSKGKKDGKESTNGNDSTSSSPSSSKRDAINGNLADRRPVSSLSLGSVSSSSSSGRMSTVSGCSGTSLGDSGTHSDTEDRRLQTSREEKSGLMSYEVPPAPKPFTGRYSPALRYSPSPRSSTVVTVHATESNLKPSQSAASSRSNLTGTGNEYYIAFPPSGLPIHCFKSANNGCKEPKTPSSPCDRPKHLLEFTMHGELSPSVPENNRLETETSSRHGNSYTNVDPSTSAPLVPSPPPGMCIPPAYCTNIHSTTDVPAVTATSNSSRAQPSNSKDEERDAVDRSNDSETSTVVATNNLKDDLDTTEHPSEVSTCPATIQKDLPRKDEKNNNSVNAVSGDECYRSHAAEIASENAAEYIETDRGLGNEARDADAPNTRNMPDYMNIDINADREMVRIVNAIPKLPSPPIPPRGISRN